MRMGLLRLLTTLCKEVESGFNIRVLFQGTEDE